MTEQIVDVLKERGMSTKGAHKFAKAIYDATEELMPGAKAVRDFVEKPPASAPNTTCRCAGRRG